MKYSSEKIRTLGNSKFSSKNEMFNRLKDKTKNSPECNNKIQNDGEHERQCEDIKIPRSATCD